MKHYAGLDVSVKETSVYIVDETGKGFRPSLVDLVHYQPKRSAPPGHARRPNTPSAAAA